MNVIIAPPPPHNGVYGKFSKWGMNFRARGFWDMSAFWSTKSWVWLANPSTMTPNQLEKVFCFWRDFPDFDGRPLINTVVFKVGSTQVQEYGKEIPIVSEKSMVGFYSYALMKKLLILAIWFSSDGYFMWKVSVISAGWFICVLSNALSHTCPDVRVPMDVARGSTRRWESSKFRVIFGETCEKIWRDVKKWRNDNKYVAISRDMKRYEIYTSEFWVKYRKRVKKHSKCHFTSIPKQSVVLINVHGCSPILSQWTTRFMYSSIFQDACTLSNKCLYLNI